MKIRTALILNRINIIPTHVRQILAITAHPLNRLINTRSHRSTKWRPLLRNLLKIKQLEVVNMNHNRTGRRRFLDAVSNIAMFCHNPKWPNVWLIKFVREIWFVESQYKIPNMKHPDFRPNVIVPFLSFRSKPQLTTCLLEIFLQSFSYPLYIFDMTMIGLVSLWWIHEVNRQICFASQHQKIWRTLGTLINRGTVSAHQIWQMLVPIVMSFVTKFGKHVDQCPIKPLDESIGLWRIWSCSCSLNFQKRAQLWHQFWHKFRSLVGVKIPWYTKSQKNFCDQHISHRCRFVVRESKSLHPLGKIIANDEYARIALCGLIRKRQYIERYTFHRSSNPVLEKTCSLGPWT